VNVGDASGAYPLILASTNAVVAICVVLVPGAAVTDAGVPVKVGDAIGAYPLILALTNAVVASCVVLVPVAGVVAAGIPVNVGASIGANPVCPAFAYASCPKLACPNAIGVLIYE
jgi:hypothetical protein